MNSNSVFHEQLKSGNSLTSQNNTLSRLLSECNRLALDKISAHIVRLPISRGGTAKPWPSIERTRADR
jgi:hypothetical protein